MDKNFNLILRSQRGLSYENLKNNSSADLTGDNCGKVIISSGSFKQTANFSQINLSSNNTRLKGNYQATFNIPSNNQYIKKALEKDPKGFYVDVEWKTTDELILFKKEKIKIRNNTFSNFDISDVALNFQNKKEEYSSLEDIAFLVNATMNVINYEPFKKPTSPDPYQGEIFYKLVEKNSNSTVIDHDFLNKSTKLYVHNNSFRTVIKAGTLHPGYLYEMQFFTIVNDEKVKFNSSFTFKVI